MSFDAGKIEATSHLDNTPFRQGLVELRRLGREAQKPLNVPVTADTKRAEADVIDFKTRVKRDIGKTNVELVLDRAKATRDLVGFSDRLDRLRAQVATARVDADTDAARQRLDALDIQLRRIGLITSKPKVDLEGVQRANLQLDALALKLAAVNRGGGGGAGSGRGGFAGALGRAGSHAPGFTGLAIGAAAPLALPAAGLAVGAGASLLTPTLAGGIGLGIFGAAAKGNIKQVSKDVEQLTKLTQRYNAATTNKQRAKILEQEHALWRSLDPAQRSAVKNVEALDESWKRFQKRLEPQSFAALAAGAKLANTGLGYLLPTAQAVGDIVVDLETRAERAFKQPFWKQFFGDFLPGEAARSVDTFGTALGHMLSGGAHLMQDFAPLGHDLEGVVVRLTGRFDKWTQGQGPVRFVNWVEQHGPEAASALEGIAHGLEGLGKGLGPIASVELKALTPVLNFIGDLGDEHPAVITALGAALLSVGAGLKVIQGASKIGGVASAIRGLFGGGPGGGVRGSTPATPLYVWDVHSGGGHGSPVSTAGKTATAAEEEAAGRGSKSVVGRVLERVGVKGALRGALTLAGPVADVAALTTRDSAPPTPLTHRSNAYAQLFALRGGKDFPSSDYTNNQLNVTAAAGTIMQSGDKQQIAGLQRLARIYPQIAAGVKAVQQQQHVLNQYLAVNTGLAAAASTEADKQTAALRRQLAPLRSLPGYLATAAAAAKSGGFVIGKSLTDGITIGIAQGEDKIVLESIKVTKAGLRASRTTAQLGSPSKITTQYGRWIAEGLAVGFGQQITHVQALFARGTASALGQIGRIAQSRLSSARQQLGADVQARGDYIGNLTASLTPGISGAVNAQGGTDSVSGFFSGQRGTEARVLHDLMVLKKRRLNPALIQQIGEAPPSQALGLAESIRLGNSGSIGTINRDYASAVSTARQLATFVGNTAYAPMIARDRELVNALQALVHEMRTHPDVVVKINDREIARANKRGTVKNARRGG